MAVQLVYGSGKGQTHVKPFSIIVWRVRDDGPIKAIGCQDMMHDRIGHQRDRRLARFIDPLAFILQWRQLDVRLHRPHP